MVPKEVRRADPVAVRGSGQQLETAGVDRADDGEVSPVECGDLGDVEPLGGGHHRCVDGSEGEIPIPAHQLGDPEPVTGHHRLDGELPGGEIAQEPDFGLCSEPTADEVGDLCDDEGRDDEGARVGEQQFERFGVVAIVGVDVGVEGSGVDQRGYVGTSAARISSMRSEMSSRPLRPAPAALR